MAACVAQPPSSYRSQMGDFWGHRGRVGTCGSVPRGHEEDQEQLCSQGRLREKRGGKESKGCLQRKRVDVDANGTTKLIRPSPPDLNCSSRIKELLDCMSFAGFQNTCPVRTQSCPMRTHVFRLLDSCVSQKGICPQSMFVILSCIGVLDAGGPIQRYHSWLVRARRKCPDASKPQHESS